MSMLHHIAALAVTLAVVQGRPTTDTPLARVSRAFCSVALAPGVPWQPSTAATRVAAVRDAVRTAVEVVRARVIGYDSLPTRERAGWGRLGAVQFLVLEVVGSATRSDAAATDSVVIGGTLGIRGELTEHDDFKQGSVPYEFARSDAQRGACFAFAYRLGAEYLLLLRRAPDGALTPSWLPLLPVNEQVHGEDDAWVTWVRAVRAAP